MLAVVGAILLTGSLVGLCILATTSTSIAHPITLYIAVVMLAITAVVLVLTLVLAAVVAGGASVRKNVEIACLGAAASAIGMLVLDIVTISGLISTYVLNIMTLVTAAMISAVIVFCRSVNVTGAKDADLGAPKLEP